MARVSYNIINYTMPLILQSIKIILGGIYVWSETF